MPDRLANESLEAACAALRAVVTERAGGDTETMQRLFHAIEGFEQAAVNAPQNRGWLRKRRIELRDALDSISSSPNARSETDEVSRLYGVVVSIVQSSARAAER